MALSMNSPYFHEPITYWSLYLTQGVWDRLMLISRGLQNLKEFTWLVMFIHR